MQRPRYGRRLPCRAAEERQVQHEVAERDVARGAGEAELDADVVGLLADDVAMEGVGDAVGPVEMGRCGGGGGGGGVGDDDGELQVDGTVEADAGDVCRVEEDVGGDGEDDEEERGAEEEEGAEVGALRGFGGQHAEWGEKGILREELLTPIKSGKVERG